MSILETTSHTNKYFYKALLERVIKGDSLYDVLNINIVSMYEALGYIDSITVLNNLQNTSDFKLQDSDISYMIEKFESFDTDKSTLHLAKYITDSNCTKIYRKYSRYDSLSLYLQHALTNIQKESLLTHAKERLRRSDYETLERLYVRHPELMIVRQECLEQIKNDVPNFQ
jgi:hypothetical protein